MSYLEASRKSQFELKKWGVKLAPYTVRLHGGILRPHSEAFGRFQGVKERTWGILKDPRKKAIF